MNWNKEVIKGPLPAWAIVLSAILSGIFFCWLLKSTSSLPNDMPHMTLGFVMGASGYLYLWLLARLAKDPPPWLRRNFRLLMVIGAILNAITILWAVLDKGRH